MSSNPQVCLLLIVDYCSAVISQGSEFLAFRIKLVFRSMKIYFSAQAFLFGFIVLDSLILDKT